MELRLQSAVHDWRSVMNLYKFHTKPNQLDGYEQRADVPDIAYEMVWDIPTDKRSRYEKVIAKDPRTAYLYATGMARGRWPVGEDAISSSPEYAYKYALYVIDARWPEGEPAIATDPGWAYKYAIMVIGGRWIEAEPVIATEARWAYGYFVSVIKSRWPEAEPIILADETYGPKYRDWFMNGDQS